ncbi:MAG: S41 family peptidase [Elusimicrobia bacterium]|nr:S41 family peptidase [Elusimicrobiota bacterium]MDE2237322.1 S41 family peptidase [Elusimicrobiota bacterium]MDE2426200.1 S41 family peptidase [Elusimicrobiota bacterium]
MNRQRSRTAVLALAGICAACSSYAASAVEARAKAAVAPSAAAASPDDPEYRKLKVLLDVMDLIRDDYYKPVDAKQLIDGAASGMVRTLDPFSQYMSPEARQEMEAETQGQFGGLGIEVGMKDDGLVIITPLPGTPAYLAGVLPNDRLVDIDERSTKDMTLSDALKLLRGEPGSKVKLTMLRPPDNGKSGPWLTKEFTLTREIVKIESVQSWMAAPGIGYLRLIEFSGHTARDARKALEELKTQGAKALVLDLRNNPGGLLTAAVELAGDFIGDGKLIVYTQGRRPGDKQEFRAAGKPPYGDWPLVVLVNGGSASASEILAGCLQDQHRALVMGMRSYGKASVQSVIPLDDGSGLRLTVAHYYTPLGRMIQRNEEAHTGGITPDIVVPVSRETEAGLYRQWNLIYERGKKPRTAAKGGELVKDETLERAVALLKARAALSSLAR